MKKNLRIVSAAAAALLAVAPVAATAIATPATTVNAETVTTATDKLASLGTTQYGGLGQLGQLSVSDPADVKAVKENLTKQIASQLNVNDLSHITVSIESNTLDGNGNVTYKFKVSTNQDWNGNSGISGLTWVNKKLSSSAGEGEWTVTAVKPAKTTDSSTTINAGQSSIFYADTNTVVNISAVAATKSAPSSINGNIVYTDAQGQSHTAILQNLSNGTNATITDLDGKGVNAKTLKPGMYLANFANVTVNLGNANINKKVTFVLGGGAVFMDNSATDNGRKLTVTTDSNGVAHLGSIKAPFWAYDSTDLQEAHFYSVKTGNIVNSGSVNLHAVNGQLNVNSVFAALTQEYKASQLTKSENVDTFVPVNDIRDQLKKQNIEVDPNGYFKAPASFSINMTAKSNNNGATATLPVTVTVDNAAQTPAAQEETKTITIMHISTIYDKNGKATHDPALRAYDTYTVVKDPVTLKDEKGNNAGTFYKLAGKDQYIKVGNVDGTSRSLKHNSYVYKSTGKRNGKKVLKKGSSVTTYGKSFMIAGHQMYRIGRNQYVKKANF